MKTTHPHPRVALFPVQVTVIASSLAVAFFAFFCSAAAALCTFSQSVYVNARGGVDDDRVMLTHHGQHFNSSV